MRAGAAAAGAALAVGPPCAELAANMANETTISNGDFALISQPNHEATAMKVPSSIKRKKRAGVQSDDGKLGWVKESAEVAIGDDRDCESVPAPTTPAKNFGGVKTRFGARKA